MGTPEHLTFQRFKPINLPFDLPVTPRQRTSGMNRRIITLQMRGKRNPRRILGLQCVRQPRAECLCLAVADETHESLSEMIGKLYARKGQEVRQQTLLFSVEGLWRTTAEPRGPFGGGNGWDRGRWWRVTTGKEPFRHQGATTAKPVRHEFAPQLSLVMTAFLPPATQVVRKAIYFTRV